MRPAPLLTAFTVLTLLAAGCASQPPAPEAAPVAPEQVTVHESFTSAPLSYRIIKRYQIESWRSAFFVPGYDTPDAAREKFREYAASLGGNGVLNFGCYRKSASANASYGCNGTVVRFQ